MRAHLEAMFRAGVDACRAERVLPPHLPDPPDGRLILLALGKAAGAMAEVAERRYGARAEGVAVVPHGTPTALAHIGAIHAGHPHPDESSMTAAARLLALAGAARAQDLVLVLLSGGASALACAPGEGLALAEKQAVVGALLRSGASIAEINRVRRHLSRIKGGRLARAAAPARVVTLALSDVVGDAPQDIGSGPTVADPTTLAESRHVLARHGIAPPARGWSETPDRVPGDFRIVARGADALAAAAAEARRFGYAPLLLGECEGEARLVGRDHARRALSAPAGTALISGGELTVAIRGDGRGGRCREYALAAAIALAGRPDISGLAADTDGIDGIGEAAGAFFDGGTVARARRDARVALAANDSGPFFSALGDDFVTGPTGTNVNDLRIILVAH